MKFMPALLAAAAAAAFAAPAAAITVVYAANLTGPSEAPPNASPGFGTALVTIDTTAQTMRVEALFAGLTGTAAAAHIHCCTATPLTGTVGVATPLPTFPGFPLGKTWGSYDATFDMSLSSSYNAGFLNSPTNLGSTSAAFATLVAGMDAGRAYFNLHSSTFPGGEIRGFLQPVPEPSTYALMAGGLALLGFAARRRKDREA